MDQDTSPEMKEQYFAHLRAMTPGERARTCAALSSGVRKLALIGLRRRHPLADDHELKVRLAVRLYGREHALRMFKDVPADAL
jgi:hypothetical protein